MLFVKRTLPLIITFISGVIMICSFFSGPALPTIKQLEEVFPKWIQIIMTFTMILGAFSLIRFNWQKIARKQNGWGYSVVLLVGFTSMALFGMISGSWPALEKPLTPKQKIMCLAPDKLSATQVEIVSVKTTEDGTKIITINNNGKEENVSADRLKENFTCVITICQQILFDGVFKPAQSTMFALLAFFVASASFRAFRIKSKEAGLLMFSAFIVMLGNVPLGNSISTCFGYFPALREYFSISGIKEWLISYPSSAAQSAILIGAMLGYISSSLKIILGIERSHLGGEG